MTTPERQTERVFTHKESLEVCLEVAEEFAATELAVDETMAPWLRLAVEEIRAGGVVTPTDIDRFQSMGTTEA